MAKITINTLLATCMIIIKSIMLPKTRVYVKGYDGKTKWMYFFLLKMINYCKDIILFEIKSALILKKNLIASLFTVKDF